MTHLGGVYGKAGTAVILPLVKDIEENKHFHISTKDGEFGTNGKKAPCTFERVESHFSPKIRSQYDRVTCDNTIKDDSKIELQQKVPMTDAQLLLIDYKTFLREHINDKNRIRDLEDFHREIGESKIPPKTIS